MLVWGFAKLDIVPGADLVHVSRQHFATRMPLYQHQAVANMFYSLARLKQCTPSLCTKVQRQVMERLEDFGPQVSSPCFSEDGSFAYVCSAALSLSIWCLPCRSS